MMHIPIKTNIAADYITWEAGIALVSQQQKEQVEKGAVTMFAFFQCVKECGGGGGGHQSENKPAWPLRAAGWNWISPTRLVPWARPRWQQSSVLGLHL